MGLVADPASEMTSWLIDGSPLHHTCLYHPRSVPDEEETGPPTAWFPAPSQPRLPLVEIDVIDALAE